MGSIALCNCNKGNDNDELNLEKTEDKKLPLKNNFTFEINEKENGISSNNEGSVEKQTKKAHHKTISGEYIVEIEDDNR
jgi:hypothetical protein